jgi:hypothetical protein
MEPPAKKVPTFSELLKLVTPAAGGQYGGVTAEQVEIFLKPRCGTYPPVCAVCGNQRWVVAEEIVKFPFWFEQNQAFTYPAVMMNCDRCGNAVFLNAVAMGLVPKADA